MMEGDQAVEQMTAKIEALETALSIAAESKSRQFSSVQFISLFHLKITFIYFVYLFRISVNHNDPWKGYETTLNHLCICN